MMAGYWAWRSWRAGKSDRRGAAFVGIAQLLMSYAVGASLAIAMRNAAVAWILYVAIEPYARRHWPDCLISWNRFTRGQLRNPLVASHILAGITATAVFFYFLYAAIMHFLGSPLPMGGSPVDGLKEIASLRLFLRGVASGPIVALAYLSFFLMTRALIPKRWAADLVAATIFNAITMAVAMPYGPLEQRIAVNIGLLIPSLTWVPLLRRFGFLSLVIVWSVQQAVVVTALKATGWMARDLITLHLIPVAVAAWAVWVIVSAAQRTTSSDATA
jgi:hypothetical protein